MLRLIESHTNIIVLEKRLNTSYVKVNHNMLLNNILTFHGLNTSYVKVNPKCIYKGKMRLECLNTSYVKVNRKRRPWNPYYGRV